MILQVFSLCSSMIVDPLMNPPPNDPTRPSPQELLVPDPRRNITCLGDWSDYGYTGNAFNERSMQQLCADRLYGGSDTAPNYQGYCNEGDVFFSSDNGLRNLAYRRDDARKLLECRNRCFCNFGLPDPQQQPKLIALTRKTFSTRFARMLSLDNRGVTIEDVDSRHEFVTRIYYRTRYVVS